MSEDCIFCQIVNKKIPAFRIYEDERSLAIADINPVTEGHVLVLPKNHAATLMELTPGDIAAVHQASQKVAQALMKSLKPGGIAVLQLNGAAAGQVVMHYHIHLIPRNP
ncbi:MAG: HIT family protein, partial [Desulfarculus sp.]|nr:HIT family protein [Desulfarculus sp.]